MVKSARKRQQATGEAEAAQTFPLAKLPLELREKVWEETVALVARHPFPRTNLRNVNKHGAAENLSFYGFRQTAVAMVCREWRACVKRLQRRRGPDNQGPLFERVKFPITVLTSLNSIKKKLSSSSSDNDDGDDGSMVPLVEDGQCLGLSLAAILHKNPEVFARASGTYGERIIDLILAAKDHQIEIVTPYTKFVCFPIQEYSSSVAKGWYSGWQTQRRLMLTLKYGKNSMGSRPRWTIRPGDLGVPRRHLQNEGVGGEGKGH